jgi:hypothetical protein
MPTAQVGICCLAVNPNRAASRTSMLQGVCFIPPQGSMLGTWVCTQTQYRHTGLLSSVRPEADSDRPQVAMRVKKKQIPRLRSVENHPSPLYMPLRWAQRSITRRLYWRAFSRPLAGLVLLPVCEPSTWRGGLLSSVRRWRTQMVGRFVSGSPVTGLPKELASGGLVSNGCCSLSSPDCETRTFLQRHRQNVK